MDKTSQTFEVIKKKATQINWGEWELKLIINDGEIIGFDQTKEPVIKFRIPKLDKT